MSDDPRDTLWWRLVNLNPALVRGGVIAVIGLLTTLGVTLSPGLSDKILIVIPLVLAIIQALWTKGSVTPNAKVLVSVPDPIARPNEVAAGQATSDYVAVDDLVRAATTKGV